MKMVLIPLMLELKKSMGTHALAWPAGPLVPCMLSVLYSAVGQKVELKGQQCCYYRYWYNWYQSSSSKESQGNYTGGWWYWELSRGDSMSQYQRSHSLHILFHCRSLSTEIFNGNHAELQSLLRSQMVWGSHPIKEHNCWGSTSNLLQAMCLFGRKFLIGLSQAWS